MLTPLFPLTEGHNFQVGDVLNGQHPHCNDAALCRDPERAYDGSDPEIRFPAGWHVKAGFGDRAGGFHQDRQRFQPWRVGVVPDRRRGTNNIRVIGGGLTPGGGELSKWFVSPDNPLREVHWSEGLPVRGKFVLIPSSRSAVRMYFNIELRGLLDFKVKKNEAVLAFGMHLTSNTLKAKYWHDGHDGIDVKDRMEVVRLHALRLNRRYKFDVTLTPIAPEYTWLVDATLRTQGETVWELHTDARNSPNGIRFLSQLALGDEQEKNLTGGVWEIARAQVWAGTGSPEEEPNDD